MRKRESIRSFQKKLSPFLFVACFGVFAVVGYKKFLVNPLKGVPYVENWESIATSIPESNNANASITLIVFFDYECPFCAVFEESVQQLPGEITQNLSIDYVHISLPGHRYTSDASLAARCAGEQGLFQEFHDELFNHALALGAVDMGGVADKLNVPSIERFTQCIEDKTYQEELTADEAMALRLNVSATPTYMINGYLFEGASPVDLLVRRIDAIGNISKK